MLVFLIVRTRPLSCSSWKACFRFMEDHYDEVVHHFEGLYRKATVNAGYGEDLKLENYFHLNYYVVERKKWDG